MKAKLSLFVAILGFFIVGMYFLTPTPLTVFNAIIATSNLAIFLYENSKNPES